MTHKGGLLHCHKAKKDANAFDDLITELKGIQNDKQTISEMELSEETKQRCYEDLDRQIAGVKERMHNAIDEM